jgi:predicted RNase H-like HicB family nuclease
MSNEKVLGAGIFWLGKLAIDRGSFSTILKNMPKRTIAKNQFRVLIERDEDGYFIATVPGLPGCHTQAKNFGELMKRVRDAIRLCLSVAKTNPDYRRRIEQFSSEPSFVGMELVSL